jgi:hypothetical protein
VKPKPVTLYPKRKNWYDYCVLAAAAVANAELRHSYRLQDAGERFPYRYRGLVNTLNNCSKLLAVDGG